MPPRLVWLLGLGLVLSCSGFDRSWGDDPSDCDFLDPAFADDEDGDGILLAHERDLDDDGDGLDNDRDLDSDGDGLSDAEEIGSRLGVCFPPQDTDGDGRGDFRDLDSDDDGLRDDEELAGRTHHLDPDTDRDGCPDGAEEILDDCSDPRDLALRVGCGAERVGFVTFRWSGPPLASVSLEVRMPDEEGTHYQLGTFPEAVFPAGGAALPSRDTETPDAFTAVESGASLIFGVEHLDVRAAGLRTEGQLALVGPAGELYDEGRLLILGQQSCTVRR